MPTQPLVSIIVPVYNAAAYLERCIESILRQTWRDFELILVDDGSTDESGQICDRYDSKDSRVRAFHKGNGGVSSARNYGLLMIRGGYLTFVDSDDWIDSGHLQNFMDKADGHDWVMQGIACVEGHGKTVKALKTSCLLETHDREESDRMLAKVPAFGWVSNKLFKTIVIKERKLKFITTSSINEDRVFNLEYSQYVRSFAMLPTATYRYMDNPGALTHSYVHPQMFVATAREYDRILRHGNLGSCMSAYTGEFCMRFYVHAIGLCMVSPLKELSLPQRFRLLPGILKKMLLSDTVRIYKIQAFKWALDALRGYAKKIITK